MYTAYCAGQCLDVADDLDTLIALMEKDMRGGTEEVVIWRGSIIAAVLQADGSTLIRAGERAGWRVPRPKLAPGPQTMEERIDATLLSVFRPSRRNQ